MADRDVGDGKEFPTQWHKDTYITNLKRELEGAKVRGYDDQVENATAELARMGVGEDGEPVKRGPGRPKKVAAE